MLLPAIFIFGFNDTKSLKIPLYEKSIFINGSYNLYFYYIDLFYFNYYTLFCIYFKYIGIHTLLFNDQNYCLFLQIVYFNIIKFYEKYDDYIILSTILKYDGFYIFIVVTINGL